jgi:hypothetical protein
MSSKYLPIPRKRHANLVNTRSMIFQTGLVHFFMDRLCEIEHGKVPNLNTVHYRVYVDRRKKIQGQMTKELWIPLQTWWFPPRNAPKLPFMMVRFTKSVYNNISRTLTKNNHALLRSYHGPMPGIIFFRHVFQFCRVKKPTNDTFVVDSCHTCPWNLSPFLIKGMQI